MRKNNNRRNQRQGLTLAQHVRFRKRKLAIELAWNRLRFQSLKLPEGWFAMPNVLQMIGE